MRTLIFRHEHPATQEDDPPVPQFRTTLLAAALAVSAPLAEAASAPSGAYLAARQASYEADYRAAARYYAQALAHDPGNTDLLRSATHANLGLGDVERALPIARRLAASDATNEIANMVLFADRGANDRYGEILTMLEEGQGVGMLVDSLVRAWAELGQGNMSGALVAFDAMAEEEGLRGFALYHKALALASVGDFEGADKVYSGEAGGSAPLTRRGVMAHIEVLSQLDRNEEALELLDESFGPELDPAPRAMREALASGERLPFTQVGSARDGLAEVFFTIASALRGEANDDFTLLYARVAEHLRPDHVDAILMSADLLERLERYELAVETLKRVPRDHPSYHAAELGRAEALRLDDKPDAAIEVLEQLAATHGDLPVVHFTLGDLFRVLERHAEAVAAYDRAIALYDNPEEADWFLYYARAISQERQDLWEEAEAGFRKALELNPGQPQVLNYLGYSLVEKQTNLEEALEMIEQAVEARPDSGYIVDSLGWALYRLGRYEEAVGHMERAAELMPVDPIVNDHLGDVYWAVGRRMEARFQWHRALSLIKPGETEDVDPDRIRRKLEVGLDQVLSEEGAPPLEVANDGG